MKIRFASACVLVAACLCGADVSVAQQSLTWEQVKARFESANPVLKADADTIDETRAAEITANLRPNPQFTTTIDGLQIAPNHGTWHPLSGTFVQPGLSYLHERDHKRELRDFATHLLKRIKAVARAVGL